MKTGFFSLTIGLVLVALSSACGNSTDSFENADACTKASNDADAFVDNSNNQLCETSADCVVEIVDCSEMTAAFCGQVSLSATATVSKQWVGLKSALDACPSSCDVCDGIRIARCDDGLCTRPSD